MNYTVRDFSDGRTDDEELKEVPKVFYVKYWPFTDDYWPRPMVVARYELVEIVEGELPRRWKRDEIAQKIVTEIKKVF
jgi:hypothetical protein